MKIRSLSLNIVASILALTITAGFASADAKKDEHAVKIPATATEIWSHLNTLQKSMHSALKKKDDHAFHGRSDYAKKLVQALPGKSGDLKAIAKKRVAGYTKSLATILDQAHHSADDKKFDAAKTKMKSYDTLVKTLKAQYPKKVTSGKVKEEDLPKGKGH